MIDVVLIITKMGKYVGHAFKEEQQEVLKLTDAVLITEAMSNRGPMLFGSYLGTAYFPSLAVELISVDLDTKSSYYGCWLDITTGLSTSLGLVNAEGKSLH